MRTVTSFALLLFSILLAINAEAQPTKKLTVLNGCSFANGTPSSELIALEASKEARQLVDEILASNPTVIQPKFTLNASNVPNAMATEINGVRYIIYSESFLEALKKQSLTIWSVKFLFAHEIGHHVYKHGFGKKTTEQSYQDELEADDFAARVLCRLGALKFESVAAIDIFDKDGGSDTHPDPEVRAFRVEKAWEEESKTLPTSTALDKKQLILDKTCFKNPWNLINEAKAEIDGEKITINIQIPPKYGNRKFRICLKSNENAVIPESRTPGSVKGTGYGLPYSPNLTIVWNYKMERFLRDQVKEPGMFKVYVYDILNQPKPASSRSKILCGTIMGVGTGAAIYGLVGLKDAKNTYGSEYKDVTPHPQNLYNPINNKYIRSQYFIGFGLGAVATGSYLLIKKLKRDKQAKKSICYQRESNFEIDPSPSLANSMGIRLNIRF